MKIPAVFLLVWAMMVLTGNACVPPDSREQIEVDPAELGKDAEVLNNDAVPTKSSEQTKAVPTKSREQIEVDPAELGKDAEVLNKDAVPTKSSEQTKAVPTKSREQIEVDPAELSEDTDVLNNDGERDLGRTLCPSGWTGYDGRCFLFVNKSMTWTEAEKNCLFHGGHLASVHSFDEYCVIQTLILRQTNAYPLTWLGGSDAQQRCSWFWSDGTFFIFSYWAPGQPDNRGSPQCLVMNFGAEKKCDDQLCRLKRASICAKNA